MAVSAGMIAKAAATVLSNEKLRKGVGWTLVAILSPIIVLIALLCSIGSGGADHNNQAVAASFYALTAVRMENTGKVRGVFDVNFDKCEFSAVHIMDGWQTCALCL